MGLFATSASSRFSEACEIFDGSVSKHESLILQAHGRLSPVDLAVCTIRIFFHRRVRDNALASVGSENIIVRILNAQIRCEIGRQG